MGKTSTLKVFVALLLVVLLFLCVGAFSHTPTKTFAAHTDTTVTPTAALSVTAEPSLTAEPSPSPTSQPSPNPTPKPSPTMAPSPTATPLPTATSIPTVVPSPTVGITPTVVVKPTVAVTPTVVVKPTMVHPTPVATQKAGAGPLPMPTATQMPTVVPTQPATAPVDITSKKTLAPAQSPLHSDSPMVPLVVGTLLTLCLGAGGFVGVRRVRTALLPAIDMKKQRNHSFAHSWQRVRTIPTAVPPLHVQETMPFSPVSLPVESAASLPEMDIPESAIVDEDAMADEGPKTGPHRRLGPVRLRKITQIEPTVRPVEAQPLSTDIEDMSFLDDPLLQDTLRQYRQKAQKKD